MSTELTCAKCDGHTKVVDSRPARGMIKRRRECLSCRYRFTTLELEASRLRKASSSKPPSQAA